MKNNLSDTYCVEYSVSQHFFHIETLDNAIDCNRGNAIRQGNADYQIIGICDTHNEARKFIRDFQKAYNIPEQVSYSRCKNE